MTDRNYSNTSTEAALTGSITSGDTSFTLASFAGFPDPPFTAAIDRATASEEVVLVTGVGGSTVTCTRGYDGTTAKSHSAGAQFLHVTVAKDYQEANGHINDSAGVHGITGSVVGTSDTQTLTNKTITSPTIAGATLTGTTAAATATFSGTITVTGNTSLSTLSTSGNANVGGTLGVTGSVSAASATLTGALAVGGASTLTGTVTVPTPTLSGHAVTKAYADALGTDAATASTIMRRDASGNTAVDAITLTDAPTAAGHAVRKDYADALVATLGDTDEDWTDLTLAGSFLAGSRGAAYRVVNGICYVAINVATSNGAWSADATISTLPAGARPGRRHWLTYHRSGTTGEVTVDDTGAIKLPISSAATSPTGISFSGSFPVEG